MHGSAGPAKLEDDVPIVVYESTDREGSTFALSPEARRMLQERFGAKFNASPRIFVAHAIRRDRERLHGRFARQLVTLLTGLDDDLLGQAGEIEFRDAVTDRRL